MSNPKSLGSILARFQRRHGLEAPRTDLSDGEMIRQAIAELRPGLEHFCSGVRRQGSTLVVDLSNPVAVQELTMLEPQLMQRMRHLSGARTVSQIRFRNHG